MEQRGLADAAGAMDQKRRPSFRLSPVCAEAFRHMGLNEFHIGLTPNEYRVPFRTKRPFSILSIGTATFNFIMIGACCKMGQVFWNDGWR